MKWPWKYFLSRTTSSCEIFFYFLIDIQIVWFGGKVQVKMKFCANKYSKLGTYVIGWSSCCLLLPFSHSVCTFQWLFHKTISSKFAKICFLRRTTFPWQKIYSSSFSFWDPSGRFSAKRLKENSYRLWVQTEIFFFVVVVRTREMSALCSPGVFHPNKPIRVVRRRIFIQLWLSVSLKNRQSGFIHPNVCWNQSGN